MMRRREVLGAAAAGALLPLFAGSAAMVEAGKPVEVAATIDNFTFSPAELKVAAGARVTWTNRDDIPHTVTDTAEPRGFRSPPLDTGESFAFAFARPGVYKYFCSLHPHMQGTVVVQ